ncbi:hypothetical protein FB451DRAFT_1571570 [Mycena latifolia]|nr:hypothetical protein FB451DRAFT_1571570 [Mycena latifolia]
MDSPPQTGTTTTTFIIETTGGTPTFHLPLPLSSFATVADLGAGSVQFLFRNKGGSPVFHVGGAEVGVSTGEAWTLERVVKGVMEERRRAGEEVTVRVIVEEEEVQIPQIAKWKENRKGKERRREAEFVSRADRGKSSRPEPTDDTPRPTKKRRREVDAALPQARTYTPEERAALSRGSLTADAYDEFITEGRADLLLACHPAPSPSSLSPLTLHSPAPLLSAEEEAEWPRLWDALLHLDRVFTGPLRDNIALKRRSDAMIEAAALRGESFLLSSSVRMVSPPNSTQRVSTGSQRGEHELVPRVKRRIAVYFLSSQSQAIDEPVDAARRAQVLLKAAMAAGARAQGSDRRSGSERGSLGSVRSHSEALTMDEVLGAARRALQPFKDAVLAGARAQGVGRGSSSGTGKGTEERGGQERTAWHRADAWAPRSAPEIDPQALFANLDTCPRSPRKGLARREGGAGVEADLKRALAELKPQPSTPHGEHEVKEKTPARAPAPLQAESSRGAGPGMKRAYSARGDGNGAPEAEGAPAKRARTTRSRAPEQTVAAPVVAAVRASTPALPIPAPVWHTLKTAYTPDMCEYTAWVPPAPASISPKRALLLTDGWLTEAERRWLSTQGDLARPLEEAKRACARPVRWAALGARMYDAAGDVALAAERGGRAGGGVRPPHPDIRPLYHGVLLRAWDAGEWRFAGAEHENIGRVGVMWGEWVRGEEGRAWRGV